MQCLKSNITRRQCLEIMAGALGAELALRSGLAEDNSQPIRFAISDNTLVGTNINDARAACKVWTSELTRELPKSLAVIVPEVFLPSDELVRDVRQGTVGAFAVTALEFAKLTDLVSQEFIIVQDYLTDGIEYVLLVHNGNQYGKLPDLRGTHLVTHLNNDLVLAPAWLGTLLAANHLGQPEHFFASQTSVDSLNQVILPVFFRRVDVACLARRSWDMAVELNPQLGRDLRPIAISPKLVPVAMGFGRGTSEASRKAVIDAILRLTSYPAGQQLLALYRTHGFVVRPGSIMNTTLDLIRQYDRLSPQRAGSRKENS